MKYLRINILAIILFGFIMGSCEKEENFEDPVPINQESEEVEDDEIDSKATGHRPFYNITIQQALNRVNRKFKTHLKRKNWKAVTNFEGGRGEDRLWTQPNQLRCDSQARCGDCSTSQSTTRSRSKSYSVNIGVNAEYGPKNFFNSLSLTSGGSLSRTVSHSQTTTQSQNVRRRNAAWVVVQPKRWYEGYFTGEITFWANSPKKGRRKPKRIPIKIMYTKNNSFLQWKGWRPTTQRPVVTLRQWGPKLKGC